MNWALVLLDWAIPALLVIAGGVGLSWCLHEPEVPPDEERDDDQSIR